ncbi:hypothetical protein LguiB_034623 [Lonicera macranthoides]
MTKDNPMTASERQRRLKKNVGTGSKKQYGIKRKPLTPPSSESTEAESESMSQTNPPTQENPDGTLTQTQTEIPAEENPSGGENQNEEVEESHDGIAADGDNDGGPVDKSILTSFSDHIAYAIWNRHEDENRELHTISHWQKLREWDLSKEVKGVQSRVKATGLTPLIDNNYRYIDYVAIEAFVERWQPETNTFHLPFGEMTITLDDVRQILGIPIEGDCFNSNEGAKEIDPKTAVTMASELLGVTEDEVREETQDMYAVRLQWLKEKCKGRAKKDSNNKTLDICARGYIMFLLGCVVFPDKTKNKISIYHLGSLKDLSKVSKIGWGMAILAHTYRQLGLASRANVKWISGCLTLVVAWICEHFHYCANAFQNMEYMETQPRMCRWKPQLCSRGDYESALITLREKLDDLTEIDVCWDPYKDHRVAHPFHEVSYYCGLLICFDIAEPHYPDRVLRQFGRVQTIPTMPMIQPSKLTRGKTAQAYKVVYSVNRWQQNNWSNHLLNEAQRSVPVKFPWECEPNYMDWFLKITHPFIQAPKQRTTMRKVCGAQDIANAKLHIVVDEALVLLDKALLGGKEEDIPIAARKVRDMIFDAKNEMTQNKGQERRTKNMHDHIATPSCSVRPQAKKKGPTKGKGPAKKKAKK